jgi:hypothetical protein
VLPTDAGTFTHDQLERQLDHRYSLHDAASLTGQNTCDTSGGRPALRLLCLLPAMGYAVTGSSIWNFDLASAITFCKVAKHMMHTSTMLRCANGANPMRIPAKIREVIDNHYRTDEIPLHFEQYPKSIRANQ